MNYELLITGIPVVQKPYDYRITTANKFFEQTGQDAYEVFKHYKNTDEYILTAIRVSDDIIKLGDTGKYITPALLGLTALETLCTESDGDQNPPAGNQVVLKLWGNRKSERLALLLRYSFQLNPNKTREPTKNEILWASAIHDSLREAEGWIDYYELVRDLALTLALVENL